MVNFQPFNVEDWMDMYETRAKYNIAETCAASISLDDLAALSEDNKYRPPGPNDADQPGMLSFVPSKEKLTYGHIRGHPQLRQNLANLYSSRASTPLDPSKILITPGAIAANYLVLYTLVSPGDHVICHYPTYQQLYSIPESLGASVTLWQSDPNNGWLPNLDILKKTLGDNPTTSLIILNNPQNPTGAILPKSYLDEIITLAKERNIAILCDEVYRPIFHSISPMDSKFPPSLLTLGALHGHEKVIVTGSLSKAYSLAGIRVGWVASRSADIIERLAAARHYTTISVSMLDSAVAETALNPSTVHALLARNIALAKTNLEILAGFVAEHSTVCSWTKPVAGTTAFVRFTRDGKPVDDVVLCRRLVDDVGVMFVPGSYAFGKEFIGYVRIGYVCETEVLREGLRVATAWLKKELDAIPLRKA